MDYPRIIKESLMGAMRTLNSVMNQPEPEHDQIIMAFGQATALFILAREAKLLNDEALHMLSPVLNLIAESLGFKQVY